MKSGRKREKEDRLVRGGGGVENRWQQLNRSFIESTSHRICMPGALRGRATQTHTHTHSIQHNKDKLNKEISERRVEREGVMAAGDKVKGREEGWRRGRSGSNKQQ